MARKPRPGGKSFDVELIRAAAARRWPEILAQLGGIDRELLDGQHHGCPRCGGQDRFRLIDADAGAVLCNQCFRDRNGDGFAALQWLLAIDFRAALERIADYVGVAPSLNGKHKKTSADPAKDLRFINWHDGLAITWCTLHKPGIKPTAMLAAGCRLARYRDQFTVFALPVWGPRMTAAEPVGWSLYNVSGGTLPKKVGDKTGQVKTKLTYGSQPGLIGPVERLADAADAWKVEGPTDLLAMLSLELPASVAVVTNANGAGEKPAPWMLELFAGKQARVLHDADEPGETGAARWCEAMATRASECRHVRLPYPVAKDHGRDLRDWINEGHNQADLLQLVDVAQPTAPSTTTATYLPMEADDDPHRLARVNLERYATRSDGRTLRFWRDEWYVWKGRDYRKIAERELRAKLSQSIKEEFNRLNVEQQQDPDADEIQPAKKVTQTLVSNVLQATAGMVVIGSSTEPMTWLPTRERRNYVAMENGILDLDALLADRDDYLLPHSPEWFSTVSLPFPFDPAATCPRWLEFLQHNLEGDSERIATLQEWAGYLLLPDTGMQKFLLMEGEGSNGKSVYLAAITAMLGQENVSNVSLEVFGDRFSRTDTIGKLANIAGDCEELDKVAEGYIKSFTSGDRMYFDRKGVSGINCVPTARLLISCNERPKFRDRSRGIWRRMLLVPWRIEIADAMKVRNMDKASWWERSGELAGIFNWAVVGLHRLRQQGQFTESRVSSAATAEYQVEVNSARAFLAEFVELSIDESAAVPYIRTDWLYGHYTRWARAGNQHPFAKTTFSKEVFRAFRQSRIGQLKEVGDYENRKRHRVYWNLRFTHDAIVGEETMDPLTLTKIETAQADAF
ncbi:MAG: phage/plasmid primase, P4 family [Pirellulales bacterium]